MRYRTIILILLSGLIVIGLLALSIGFITAFINDKFGANVTWAVLIILVALSLIYLLSDEIKSKKELTIKKSHYLELGKLLFKNHQSDFEVFYNAYLQADQSVSSKDPTPIETLHEFANKKGLSLIIDCAGEENEAEIEDFISAQIGTTISWINTAKLRENNEDIVLQDSKFIVRLFKAIDKDLREIKKKLLFFELGTDTYIFTVTDTTTFRDIMKIESGDFYGSEKIERL